VQKGKSATLVNESSPAQILLELTSGYWISQAIYVVAKLAIADLLKDGAKNCDELAQATNTHAQSLVRVMRTLASVGVFTEVDIGRFGLTPLAEPLQTNVPDSIRAWAIMLGEESYRAWSELQYTVKTGKPAFDQVYKMRRFEYLERHPDAAEVFNTAMTGLYRRVHTTVVKAYSFVGFSKIVDVGGGNGFLISLILNANPHLTGTLFETSTVIEDAKKNIETAGLAARCETVAGDFFLSVPEGGDAYLLAHVMQSFDDDRSVVILRNCHRAMPEHGKLLLVEPVISRGDAPSFAKLLDLHMLVVTGGRQRTEVEYGTLLALADLRLRNVVATESGESVIEAMRV
jgi:O-methyltransferase domain/Dimerisation domain